MLMCRGRKHFNLENCQAMTSEQFEAHVEEQQSALAALQSQGETACLAVERYRGERRCLMYVFEGLKSEDEPEFLVPIHFFHFQQFRPEVMRLNRSHYFTYYPEDPETTAALNKHSKEARFRYRHFLSYEGLLQCLELNELIDAKARTHVDAHYTFLGQFLHPTHDAARRLRDQDNYHDGGTALGTRYPYTKVSTLLASLYIVYLMAGFIDEAASVIEGAPKRYVSDPGAAAVRTLSQAVPEKFSYFWFINNEAPLWDKFYWAIHATPEERAPYPSFAAVPTSVVTFNQHIYGQLQSAINGGSSSLGTCPSPLSLQ
jgi:hypothetical protein